MFSLLHNNLENLVKLMLVFLLTMLTGKKVSINLYSKLVHDLKSKYSHDTLLAYSDKAHECNYNIYSIIIDGQVMSMKANKKLLNLEINNNNVPIAQLKLEIRFTCDKHDYFVLFHIPHLLKSICNAMFGIDIYFYYPRLFLSMEFALEARICSVKYR